MKKMIIMVLMLIMLTGCGNEEHVDSNMTTENIQVENIQVEHVYTEHVYTENVYTENIYPG